MRFHYLLLAPLVAGSVRPHTNAGEANDTICERKVDEFEAAMEKLKDPERFRRHWQYEDFVYKSIEETFKQLSEEEEGVSCLGSLIRYRNFAESEFRSLFGPQTRDNLRRVGTN